MILNSFKARFENLKRNNVNITCALDIGAYRGDFTQTLKIVYPDAKIFQIEADERQRVYLREDAIIALLGNREQDNVNFYTLDADKITTGSSIFLEQTKFYNTHTTVTLSKTMTTLDKLHSVHKFLGDWQNSGLVKIDTQGSELLILDGAVKFFNDEKPKYVLLECSIQEYNAGAPKIISVMEYMNKLDYSMIDIFDLSYDDHNQLLQIDVLFERHIT